MDQTTKTSYLRSSLSYCKRGDLDFEYNLAYSILSLLNILPTCMVTYWTLSLPIHDDSITTPINLISDHYALSFNLSLPHNSEDNSGSNNISILDYSKADSVSICNSYTMGMSTLCDIYALALGPPDSVSICNSYTMGTSTLCDIYARARGPQVRVQVRI